MTHQFDKFPQFLRGRVVESAANTFTDASINTNVPVQVPKGKTLILNLLKVHLGMDPGTKGDGDRVQFQLYTGRARTAMANYEEAGTLIFIEHITNLVTQGGTEGDYTKIFDFSDGNGHGILIAAREIRLSVLGVSQAAALTCRVAIEYTLVEVEADELVGLVTDY